MENHYFHLKTHVGHKPTSEKHIQEIVCPLPQRAIAQHGWSWHTEPHHLVDANCDVWRCLGRGPPAQWHRGATGGYHQSQKQKALNFISISILFPCAGGVDPVVRCAAHTQVRVWRLVTDGG